MSFSTEIKNEISTLSTTRLSSIAELSGYVRNNATISDNKIILNTENKDVAKRIIKNFKEIYDVRVKIKATKNIKFNRNILYLLTIDNKVNFILKDLNVIDEDNNYLPQVHSYLTEDNEEKKAYIRGAFLSKGSINDPKTSRYHMELLIDSPEEAVFLQRIINTFDLNAKILTRDKGYMIYLKEAEKISDFIKLIQANKAVMYYEDIRVLRDKKNKTNRLNNCEQANTDKIVESAMRQLNDIDIIKEKMGIELLDEKLQEVISFRIKYREASLQELSEIMSNKTNKKITKSGLNHRFRKIKEIANKLN